MKKSGYKYQLEEKLNEFGWQVNKIDTSGEWWDDEHWLVEHQYDRNLQLYVCFIVDPQFETPRKKGQGIYCIKACEKFPETWLDDSSKIASIEMTKRKFDLKLREFITDLDTFRKEIPDH